MSQEYEIHEEGILFSHLSIEIPSAARIALGDCSLTVALDLESTRQARWGHFMRDYAFKRDFSSLHALPVFKGFLTLDQRVEAGELRNPSPIGLYFARLWYSERLYPLIWTVGALGRILATGAAREAAERAAAAAESQDG